MVTWLIATKASVTGNPPEFYGGPTSRPIIKSNVRTTAYSAAWYYRASQPEDPWISTGDHGPSTTDGQMVYGENGFNAASYVISIVQHQGNNVFIRKCPCN